MQGKILLVDDDVDLARHVAEVLRQGDFEVTVAYTAEDGLRLAFATQPDVALLDVMVPTMGGWELCRQLRALSDMPILFLTALDDVDHVVRGLEMGADDYLVKPFEKRVLQARIRALLRRRPSKKPIERISLGQGRLVIDLPGRTVQVEGRDVELTPREFDLLAVLARNAGRVVTTRELLLKAWGMAGDNDVGNIKPYIHYLRKKIEADSASPRWIITARGIGYRLVDE